MHFLRVGRPYASNKHSPPPPVLQVFDRDKGLRASVYVGAPVGAVAYLNDQVRLQHIAWGWHSI